jgi:hypothetical protein
MTAWTTINILSSIIVAMIVTFKLLAYPDQFNLGERVGMGMTAGGMLMRIGPILGHGIFSERTPFDDWSVTLLHVGLAVYFMARLARIHRHWIANQRAKQAAREWIGGIGR